LDLLSQSSTICALFAAVAAFSSLEPATYSVPVGFLPIEGASRWAAMKHDAACVIMLHGD
jgi:hypothetical protein